MATWSGPGDSGWAVPGSSDTHRDKFRHLLAPAPISKSVTAVLLMRLVGPGGWSPWTTPLERYLPEIGGWWISTQRAGRLHPSRGLASHTLRPHPGARLLPGAALRGHRSMGGEWCWPSIPSTGFAHPPGEALPPTPNIGLRHPGAGAGEGRRSALHGDGGGGDLPPPGDDGLHLRGWGMSSSPAWSSPAGYQNGRDGSIDGGESPAAEHAGRGYNVPTAGSIPPVADLGRSRRGQWRHPGAPDPLRAGPGGDAPGADPGGIPTGATGSVSPVRVDDDGRRIVSHGGSVSGYHAHLAFDPEARVSVILLRNYGSGATQPG